ncbi:unnamed protein product, partial [Amoebophrya sp. A25]
VKNTSTGTSVEQFEEQPARGRSPTNLQSPPGTRGSRRIGGPVMLYYNDGSQSPTERPTIGKFNVPPPGPLLGPRGSLTRKSQAPKVTVADDDFVEKVLESAASRRSVFNRDAEQKAIKAKQEAEQKKAASVKDKLGALAADLSEDELNAVLKSLERKKERKSVRGRSPGPNGEQGTSVEASNGNNPNTVTSPSTSMFQPDKKKTSIALQKSPSPGSPGGRPVLGQFRTSQQTAQLSPGGLLSTGPGRISLAVTAHHPVPHGWEEARAAHSKAFKDNMKRLSGGNPDDEEKFTTSEEEDGGFDANGKPKKSASVPRVGKDGQAP